MIWIYFFISCIFQVRFHMAFLVNEWSNSYFTAEWFSKTNQDKHIKIKQVYINNRNVPVRFSKKEPKSWKTPRDFENRVKHFQNQNSKLSSFRMYWPFGNNIFMILKTRIEVWCICISLLNLIFRLIFKKLKDDITTRKDIFMFKVMKLTLWKTLV